MTARHLYRVGIDLRTRPAAERAAWHLDPERLDAEGLRRALEETFAATDEPAIPEAFALSTCARSEVYVAAAEPVATTRLRELFLRLLSESPSTAELTELEIDRDEQAVAHLLRIASGLDSPLLGEAEILGQLRRALGRAVTWRRGSLLVALGQRAVAAGRAVRRRFGLRLDYARAIERLGGDAPRCVAVVGSGPFAGRLARDLADAPARESVTLFAHDLERARGLRLGRATLEPLDALGPSLDELDLLVLAARGGVVLGSERLARRFRPLRVVDLGSTPSLGAGGRRGDAPGIEWLSLDDLSRRAKSSGEERAARRAERLVRRLADDFCRGWRVRLRLAGRRLVLAAHGAGDGSPANVAIEALGEELGRRLGRLEVDTAFHLGTPSFASLAGRPDALVLPLLTSDGFFRRHLESAASPSAEVLPPLGTDPRLLAMVVRALEEKIRESDVDPGDLAVLVVGHGTRRSAPSGQATRRVAATIRQALPGAVVGAAFLDQDPELRPVAKALVARRPVLAVVPFLLGGGSHAREDIDAALGDLEIGRRLDLPPLLDAPRLPHVLTAIISSPARRREILASELGGRGQDPRRAA